MSTSGVPGVQHSTVLDIRVNGEQETHRPRPYGTFILAEKWTLPINHSATTVVRATKYMCYESIYSGHWVDLGYRGGCIWEDSESW